VPRHNNCNAGDECTPLGHLFGHDVCLRVTLAPRSPLWACASASLELVLVAVQADGMALIVARFDIHNLHALGRPGAR